jgi:uncharacterized integral membrane protein
MGQERKGGSNWDCYCFLFENKIVHVLSNVTYSPSHCQAGTPMILIYLLTAVGLTPGGSSKVHIYTQTIHRTTQLTTLFGRLSGIRSQSGQSTINDELTA